MVAEMKQKTKETIGYFTNALSIALLFYLMFTLEIPDLMQPLVYIGWILLGLGVSLIALSIAVLVGNRGAGLIERGVYGIVRHPMYVGAMLCFLSFFFFHPHWIILLISSVNIIVVYWFILQGEQLNIAKFSDTYKRYMETVPRINLLAGLIRRLQNK